MTRRLSWSDILKSIRQAQNFTQEQLAQRLGVSFVTVNRWENGRNVPSSLAQAQIKTLIIQIGEQAAEQKRKEARHAR